MATGRTRRAISGRFEGKVAIVTGGSVGIGRAVADELCREGAQVVLTGLEADLCVQADREIKALGYDVVALCGDMADEGFCREVVGAAVKRWGKLHYLINNAFSFTSKWIDASRGDWHRVMDVGPIAYATVAAAVRLQDL